MSEFTHDWSSIYFPVWEPILGKFKDEPVQALEIGCYEGRATLWLLEKILTHPEARIVCVDTFEGSDEHKELGLDFSKTEEHFRQNTARWRDKIWLCKGRSETFLRQLEARFDIVFIDGSHNAWDVLTDAVLAWPLLRQGGVMIFDDYGWDRFEDKARNPRAGIDAFTSCFEGHFTTLHRGYQVILEKK